MAQILRPDQTIARSNLDSSHDEYYDINLVWVGRDGGVDVAVS